MADIREEYVDYEEVEFDDHEHEEVKDHLGKPAAGGADSKYLLVSDSAGLTIRESIQLPSKTSC